MDGDLGGLFTSDDDGKNITVNLPEKKYHFDFNFSWLVWVALMFMIVFFRGDPDLHDATIDYVMHKSHKEWIEVYRDYDKQGHKSAQEKEVEEFVFEAPDVFKQDF